MAPKYRYPKNFKDLTGKKFGRLTVIERNYSDPRNKKTRNKKKRIMWLCKCECGTEKIIDGGNLKQGLTKSCGCLLKSKRTDLTGKKFGRLTVIKRSYPNGKGYRARWLCKCECGTEKIIRGDSIKGGTTKSCGCLVGEYTKNNPTHILRLGLANMRKAINGYKWASKRRGLEWNLTEKQFEEITQKECYYCGIKPSNIQNDKQSNGSFIYNGLDRIDNSKGYTINNVVPCCYPCNRRKGKSTLQEYKDWIKRSYNKMFNCGSELREIPSNKQTDKQKFRRSLIDKVLETRKNLRSGNL